MKHKNLFLDLHPDGCAGFSYLFYCPVCPNHPSLPFASVGGAHEPGHRGDGATCGEPEKTPLEGAYRAGGDEEADPTKLPQSAVGRNQG